MTDYTDLIARLRAGCLPKGIASHWGDLQMEAADALEALQAELDEWRFTNKIDELQRVNEGLQAEVARLREKESSLDRLLALFEEVQVVADERDSALARLAEIEAQESVATVLLHEGEKIIDGTMAFMDTAWLGMPLFAAAGASPQPSQAGELSADDVRAAGGIVHSDGNIFFTNIGKLNAAINAKVAEAKLAQPERAEDSVNAKRYLWLRDEAYSASGKTPFIVIGRDDSDCYVVSGLAADEAIDEAIKQGDQHEKDQ